MRSGRETSHFQRTRLHCAHWPFGLPWPWLPPPPHDQTDPSTTRRDFALGNLDCEHCQFSAGESWFSGRHFVENRPERKEVGTGVHRQTERLFGAHVARCADKLAHLRPLKRGRIGIAHSLYPEVEQFHGLPVFGDENVGWLYVAMHDPHAMRIAESLGELQS